MKKKLYLALVLICLILVTAYSIYQYRATNKNYAGYKLSIVNTKLDTPIKALGLTQAFGKAKTEVVEDDMLNKITKFSIPFTIKNDTNKDATFHPEFYRLMRGEDMTQSIDFIDNRTKKRVYSIPPYTTIKGEAKFTYNDMNKTVPLQLNINSRDGITINLFKIPVYK
ncbi:hypothetical protein [Bacillus velezensis]|uniref:hypothetical protein n=1 Tax=Bacillus velezensis TaxID=492670 RepID=UPI0030CFE4FB